MGLVASPVYTSMGALLRLPLRSLLRSSLIEAAGAPLEGALSRRCCFMSVWNVEASNITDGDAMLASVP